MAGESTTRQRPAGGEAERERSPGRRGFLRKVRAAAALAAAGAVAEGALGGGPASVAEAAPTAERDELRERFIADARASLEQLHPFSASAAESLSDAALADLGDPSGRRAAKLLASVPDNPIVEGTPATAPAKVQNILMRMQSDLQRALKKRIEERRWAMAIDLRKCIGCSACTVACKAENKLPPGVVYRPVVEQEVGTYPRVSRRFIPRPCMQCDRPPCVPVCPVGATYKRPDGIVEIDYNVCIGCRYCIAACPYGARTFDWGETYTGVATQQQPYEKEASFEYGRSWTRKNGESPAGNVRKCQFCLHRLAEGMLPACTTTCVGAATYFGDANDPDSLVSDLIHRPNVMRLKEELGTEPKVYYLL